MQRVATWLGLIALVLGTVLWLYPRLPASSEHPSDPTVIFAHPYPAPHFSALAIVLCFGAGVALLAYGRR
ncbi:MAG: hypothetical protein ACYC6M_11080 [Terriglobales bacterium]